MAVDLHIHSTASDGTVPPGDLPQLAADAKLKAIALTDHDTTAGITDFLAKQEIFPQVELIPGVEISSIAGAREVHIVGLFIDCGNGNLQKFLQEMRNERVSRAERMLEKLRSLGYDISDDDLRRAGMNDEVPGRPHFARVLINKYNFPDNAAVFARVLGRHCAGYVPRRLPAPEEAIRVIKNAGGTAVWAHPFSARNNDNNLVRRWLPVLKNAGLDALEAYYSEYDKNKTATALRIAAENSLAVSGGSDFHGSVHPDTHIGSGKDSLCVPDETVEILRRKTLPKVVLM